MTDKAAIPWIDGAAAQLSYLHHADEAAKVRVIADEMYAALAATKEPARG